MSDLTPKLNVSLYDNTLTPEKDDFTGKVQSNGTLTNAHIARDIVNQRSEFRYETILSILNQSDEIKRNRLASGFSINDGVALIYPSVSGRFVGSAAQFDPSVHSVGVAMAASAALRKLMADVKVVVHGVALVGPVINKVTDVYTNSENTTLTPGRNLKIFGQHLRIAGEDPGIVGVWFVNVADGSRFQVEERDLVDNKPSQLTIVVPYLMPGDYQIEVVTQSMSGGKEFLKEPRTYRFELVLACS